MAVNQELAHLRQENEQLRGDVEWLSHVLCALTMQNQEGRIFAYDRDLANAEYRAVVVTQDKDNRRFVIKSIPK